MALPTEPRGPSLPPAGGPAWLAPLVTITTQLGVPTVFAGVLLWFVLFKVGGTLEKIEDNELERTKLLVNMQELFVSAVQRQSEASAKLLAKLDYCREAPSAPR
jgi:hypothetical protein